MKYFWTLVLIQILVAVPALAQAPILSDSALNMTMSVEDCMARAERAFLDLGYKPARYPGSVFADRQKDHLVIRCTHSHIGVIFLAGAQTQPMKGGGPGPILDRLKEAMSRR